MINKFNEKYYSNIADSLNHLIPIKWEKIVLCAEVGDGEITTYFYFYDSIKHDFVQGGDLTREYSVDDDELSMFTVNLYKQIMGLHNDMLEKSDDDWSTITFILNSDGKFKVEFGYDDLTNSSQRERRKIWKKKYLQ